MRARHSCMCVSHLRTTLLQSDGYFSRRLQHLPPVDVVFALGPDYPASSPPGLTLECPWLPDDKVRNLGVPLPAAALLGFAHAERVVQSASPFPHVVGVVDFEQGFS